MANRKNQGVTASAVAPFSYVKCGANAGSRHNHSSTSRQCFPPMENIEVSVCYSDKWKQGINLPREVLVWTGLRKFLVISERGSERCVPGTPSPSLSCCSSSSSAQAILTAGYYINKSVFHCGIRGAGEQQGHGISI